MSFFFIIASWSPHVAGADEVRDLGDDEIKDHPSLGRVRHLVVGGFPVQTQ